MVTINIPTMNTGSADPGPVMPRHNLKAKVKTKTFNEGEQAIVFISKMSDGRFAVMDASFMGRQKHYEVHTEESLHESFDEI